MKCGKIVHKSTEKRKMGSTTVHYFPVLLLTIAILLNESGFSSGLCNIRKNGTLARCNYLEDIKTVDKYDLKSLKVSSVDKTHLSADNFINLTNLKHLDLSNTKLKNIKAGCFHHLSNLRSLDISNNYLTHLDNDVLTDLPHLKVLNLSKNLFSKIPRDVDNLKNLKILDLSHNKLFCDCKTLKDRDFLIERGVLISKKTTCSAPTSLKGQLLIDSEMPKICKHVQFSSAEDEGMQMDQPMMDDNGGSGEGISSDPFDEIQPEDIPDDDVDDTTNEEKLTTELVETTTTLISMDVAPLTPSTVPTSTNDGIFFSENGHDKHVATPPTTIFTEPTTVASTESIKISTTESELDKKLPWSSNGSGDDDLEDPWAEEGSGFEGSGVNIPHINWDEDPVQSKDDRENVTTVYTGSSTTEPEGFLDSLYSLFWGTTTPEPSSTTELDLNLEEEQFIKASEVPEVKPSSSDAEIIIPRIMNPVDADAKTANGKSQVSGDSKSGQVKLDVSSESAETSADAASSQQTKKGVGSYVVLAVLLGVLAVLIGFAAYKGDFCKERRKRNNRNIAASDMENGTEMKDLRKSLLDNNPNAVLQPKISSTNGNGKSPEEAPLMVSSSSSPHANEIHTSEKPDDSAVDPVKPPRKLYSPHDTENGTKAEKNGNISNITHLSACDNPVPSSRMSPPDDIIYVNGKNERDSLSSVGESPSSGLSYSAHLSNSRLSQGHMLPPTSPGAQRVKITLQENPDSVPKTPLLITRTKAGENLVKTP